MTRLRSATAPRCLHPSTLGPCWQTPWHGLLLGARQTLVSDILGLRNQLDQFKQILAAQSGVERVDEVPSLRARIPCPKWPRAWIPRAS